MNEILKTLLSLSLSGSVFIPVLLLCKPVFKNRMSRQWQYYIWLAVIIRMLLPFSPEISPVGTLFQEIDRTIVQTNTIHASERDSAPAQQPERDAEPGPQVEETETAATLAEQRIFSTSMQNLWLAWPMISLILLIRKITIYQDFVKYVMAGCVEVSDITLLDCLAKTGKQAGVTRPVELYANSLVSSPMLLGFFRPCIVLPTTELSDTDFQYTILHELTHYRRRDMFYKCLVQLVICLHWFNPLVHVMGREVERACELACDEAVIKRLDAEGQRAYGDTLINAIGVKGCYKNNLASVMLNESKDLLKERLEAIMIYRKKTKLAVAVSLVMTVVLACGAAAIGAYTAPAAKTGAAITGTEKDKVQYEGAEDKIPAVFPYHLFRSDAGEGSEQIYLPFDKRNSAQ